jgi:hypothetical protein
MNPKRAKGEQKEHLPTKGCCRQCLYWEPDGWEIIGMPDHPDNRGQCHRHAPRPQLLTVSLMHKMLETVWSATKEGERSNLSDDEWDECSLARCHNVDEWPLTTAERMPTATPRLRLAQEHSGLTSIPRMC